jgi:hypothetical protein
MDNIDVYYKTLVEMNKINNKKENDFYVVKSKEKVKCNYFKNLDSFFYEFSIANKGLIKVACTYALVTVMVIVVVSTGIVNVF